MSALVARLVERAFRLAPAVEANAAIDEVRAQRGLPGAEAQSYEVALPALGADEYLVEKVLPRLVYFLDCRGVAPSGSPQVFVSLFTTQGLFFLDSGAFVRALAEAKGLSLEEARRRYGRDGTGAPLLLGGG